MRTRAERRDLTRRKHRQRLGWLRKRGRTEEEVKRYNNINLETPKDCSCVMCGNPRKYGETTVQERRNNG